MNIWRFLKRRMLRYKDKIAFADCNITYEELIRLVEKEKTDYKKQYIIVENTSRLQQAICALKIIANGNIPIPVDYTYGQEKIEKIKELILNNKEMSSGVALLMFTSGTTGIPKGVKLSHRNIIANLKGIDKYFKVFCGEKLLILRPIVHIAVFTGELLFGLYKGLEISFYEEPFQPKRVANYIENNHIQIFCCTPTILYHLSRFLKSDYLKSVVISGERLMPDIVSIIKEKCSKVDFYNVYGLTENSPRVSALGPKDFFNKIGSVGKPIAHTKIKIENGELLVRSPSVMQGYIGDYAATKEKIKKGYLCTGDMAKIDEEGYLYILGRKDDMIIRSGMNIYPAEIENVVRSIGGVENCLVYGEQDVRYGQKVCLKVVSKIDIVHLRKELSRNLPAYLVPDKIEIVDVLELTPSGKVIRK